MLTLPDMQFATEPQTLLMLVCLPVSSNQLVGGMVVSWHLHELARITPVSAAVAACAVP